MYKIKQTINVMVDEKNMQQNCEIRVPVDSFLLANIHTHSFDECLNIGNKLPAFRKPLSREY